MNRSITKIIGVSVLILLVVLLCGPLVIAEPISENLVEGVIVYSPIDAKIPRYRLWNSSIINFSEENNYPFRLANDNHWMTLRANHERDEILMAVQDQGFTLSVAVYDNNDQWSEPTNLTSQISVDVNRGHDFAFEDISGDALIVYEGSQATGNNMFAYRIWDGKEFSEEVNFTSTLDNSNFRWIKTVARVGTDEVMVLAQNDILDLTAVLWNGTSFEPESHLNMSLSTTSDTEEHFDFAWEGNSSDGLVTYGEGSNLVAREYKRDTNTWSSELNLAVGNQIDGSRHCASPDSNYIGVIAQTGSRSLFAYMWNGTEFLSGEPSANTNTEANGLNAINFDCVWLNSTDAMFAFVDRDERAMSFFNFSMPNTWSTTDLSITEDTHEFAAADIKMLRLKKHPINNEFMVVALDLQEDLTTTFWNGTSFLDYTENVHSEYVEVIDGRQEGAMFTWYNYDPEPTINTLTTNVSTISINESINITANITDNIAVDIVQINITKPGGETLLYNTNNMDEIYNLTFNVTDEEGVYTIRVFANDTSKHQNLNNESTTTFSTVSAAIPIVVLVSPEIGNVTTIGNMIVMSANVTDGNGVDTVVANLTYPNGTKTVFTLTNTTDPEYNTTFLDTSIIGEYNITFIANDTVGDINDDVTTNFTIIDTSPPNVTEAIPIVGSTINLGDEIEIAVNVSDNIEILSVIANITIPTGAVDQVTLFLATGEKYNRSYAPGLEGEYNITFIANDTSQNVNTTVTTNFTSVDIIPPSISAANCYPNPGGIDYLVQCNATITDNAGVDTVIVNMTLPNGTKQEPKLDVAGSFYNITQDDTSLIGEYNLTWWANDTNGNTNATSEFFNISDFKNPAVSAVLPLGDTTVNALTEIEIAANVTDNHALDTVLANITMPNGTKLQQSLTLVVGDKYNVSYTPPIIGYYNITIVANDTSNNINDTETTNITATDGGLPTVIAPLPPTGSAYNISNIFEVAVNVTDDIGLSSVTANVTMPNGTVDILSLNLATGDKYNNTYTAPALKGEFNITYVAIDGGENTNATTMSNFTVSDVVLPTISMVGCDPDPTTIGSAVNCNATITDDASINSVLVNITMPNGTLMQPTVDNTGSFYNITQEDTTVAGTYNVVWFASDVNGNTNETSETFIVNDIFNPTVTDVLPIIGSTATVTTAVEVAANVTDDATVDTVIANITLPNGTLVQQSLTLAVGNKYNGSYNVPILGEYNITIVANDTSSNINDTEITNVTAVDIENPIVIPLSPTIGTDYSIADTINIGANATDTQGVNWFVVNITYPNGTLAQNTMTLTEGNTYNNSFVAPALLGEYNLTFIANDTSQNVNNTETTNFTVSDNSNPVVLAPLPIVISTFNIGDIFEVAVNVTDDLAINAVTANITYPNGTVDVVTLSLSIGDKYNDSFTAPALAGEYNITYVGIDTSQNTNATTQSNFTVTDIVNPTITDVLPLIGSSATVTTAVELAANVTDDATVDTVIANITLPNGTLVQQSLTLAVGNKYNGSYNVPILGEYNITIVANDTSSNINDTEITNVTALDITTPIVIPLSPTAGSGFSIADNINIGANASDGDGIAWSVVNITYPNGTLQQSTMTLTEGNTYNFSFGAPALLGEYNLTFIANDTSDNVNSTEITNFTVSDNSNPVVVEPLPIEGSGYNVADIFEVAVNVTDDLSINAVTANITYPNGTIDILSLSLSTGDKYNNSYTAPELAGAYNITFVGIDTSQNTNATTMSNFTVTDNTEPTISMVGCDPDPTTIGQAVNCNATITDDVSINSVLVNITMPNGTLVQPTVDNTGSFYNITQEDTTVAGTYNVVWFASDVNGNTNETSETFVINDAINPSVSSLLPTAGSPYNVSNSIEISAEVADNAAVDTVLVNITFPNGTLQQTALTFATGNTYNSSFVAPIVTGEYNLTFIANDTSNNLNDTETTNFTVNDVVIPTSVFNAPDPGENFAQFVNISIEVNVTDDVSISTVTANITLPNTTVLQLDLFDLNADGMYNQTLNDTSGSGAYVATAIVADTSGNVNDTSTRIFNVLDGNVPIMTLVTPIDTAVRTTNIATFICNATDSSGLANVSLYHNISQPFGINETVIATGTGNETSFPITNIPDGEYVWNCEASDIANNTALATSNFSITFDTTAPNTTVNAPTSGKEAITGSSIFINATVIDAIGVSTVLANITFPNGTSIQEVLVDPNIDDLFNATFTIPELIGEYNITFIANDTSNNINDTEITNFSAIDIVNPIVTAIFPLIGDSISISNPIEIAANVTDNIAISNVVANITLPNGSKEQEVLSLATGNKYNATYTTVIIGEHNISIIATDTSNNINDTGTTNFTVNDNKNPEVFDPIPIAESGFNIGDVLEIGINATDDVSIASVSANVTYPNGTVDAIVLVLSTGDKFNKSFIVPGLSGEYNITYVGIDTSQNTNATTQSNFTVTDIVNPTVTDVLPLIGSTATVTTAVELAANVTDDATVDTVIANITLPNGTVEQSPLALAVGNKYNASYTVPIIGEYNITIIANDTSNNINDTEITNVTALDITTPIVIPLSPTTGSGFSIADTINIGANATDGDGIAWFVVNITYPNGTLAQNTMTLTEGNTYNNSFVAPTLLGEYNLTFIANDTSDNVNSTETTNFTVSDNSNPVVVEPLPTEGTGYNIADVFEVAVNVTDDLAVSAVTANVTYPNGTVDVVALSLSAGDKFNNSYTAPELAGEYNITYVGIDTSQNTNATTMSNFTVSDVNNPAVIAAIPSIGIVFNAGSNHEIAANVTDDGVLTSVSANITYPNGTIEIVPLSLAVGDKFNNSFIVPSLAGEYNITYIGIDTGQNTNATTQSNFTVNDVTNPTVIAARPLEGSSFNNNDIFEVAVNVTDNIAISTVSVNITHPNSTVESVTLSLGVGDKYNNSYTAPGIAGEYNITYVGIDTSQNTNATTMSNFTINDTIIPTIIPNGCGPNPANVNNFVRCNGTITDLGGLDVVEINVTMPNGTKIQPKIDVVSNYVNTTIEDTSVLGTYNVTWWARDLSGNVNTTTEFFNVSDFSYPAVTGVLPLIGSTATVANAIEVAANVTDNVGIDTVLANITLPNGTQVQQTLTLTIGDKYNVSYIMQIQGEYNITIIANDTSSNINDTETTNITAQLPLNPAIFALIPNAGSTINITDPLEIGANVTDSLSIVFVGANVTYPNGTIESIALTLAVGDKYNSSYLPPSRSGEYNVTFFANNTADNSNATETTNFTIIDTKNPVVNGPLPGIGAVYNVSVPFEIAVNVTDNDPIEIVSANISYPNGTVENITLSFGFGDKYNASYTAPNVLGAYNITYIATDISQNTNDTTTRTFTVVDQVGPTISLVGCDPNPTTSGQAVNCNATITDDGAVNLVEVNITLPNGTEVQPFISNISSLYTITQTDTSLTGTYNVTWWAIDASANTNETSESFVITDPANWTRTPVNFDVDATPRENVSLVNITLNNIGGSALNFTMFSTLVDTFFNESSPLLLESGEERIVEVHVAAPSGLGTVSFNIAINATPNATPVQLNTSGSLNVAEGQPSLIALFNTTIPENLTRGQSVTINGSLDNIGIANATNGTFFFTINSSVFTITAGTLNTSYTVLTPEDAPLSLNITLLVSDSAPLGETNITINATGLNNSGIDLTAFGGILWENRTINVTAVDDEDEDEDEDEDGGSGGGSGGGSSSSASDERSTIPSSTSSEGSTEGASSYAEADIGGESSSPTEVRYSDTEIYVLRSGQTQFWYDVTNTYSDTVMRDVNLVLSGELSSYMNMYPDTIAELAPGEKGEFLISITLPEERFGKRHQMNFNILSNRKRTETTENNEDITVTEQHGVSLILIDPIRESPEDKIELAYDVLKLFAQYDIQTKTMEAFTANMEGSFGMGEFDLGEIEYKEILENAELAINAYNILRETENIYEEARVSGYDVGEFGTLIQLTQAAFEREDFATAFARAQELQAYQVIYKKDASLATLLLDNILLSILIIIIFIVAGYAIERKKTLLDANSRIIKLDLEELSIKKQMVSIEKEYKIGEMSRRSFYKQMHHYEERLDANRKQQAKLKRHMHFMPSKREIFAYIKRDSAYLRKRIKEAQKHHYELGKSSREEYLQNAKHFKSKLVENAKEKILLITEIYKHAQIRGETKSHIQNAKSNNILNDIKIGQIRDALNQIVKIAVKGITHAYFTVKKWMRSHVFHPEKECKEQRNTVLYILAVSIVVGAMFALLINVQFTESSLTGSTIYDIESVQEKYRMNYDKPGSLLTGNTIADIEIIPEKVVALITNDLIREYIRESEKDIKVMSAAKLNTEYVNGLLSEMIFEGQGEDIDLERITKNSKRIRETKEEALHIVDILQIKHNEITAFADETHYDVSEVWTLYYIALAALDEEQYTDANTMIEQITPALGAINSKQESSVTQALNMISDMTVWAYSHLLGLILLTIILGSAGFVMYFNAEVHIARQQLENTNIEIEVLKKLIRKSQRQFYKSKTLTRSIYDMEMLTYKERKKKLEQEIKKLHAGLKNRIARHNAGAQYYVVPTLKYGRALLGTFLVYYHTGSCFAYRKILWTMKWTRIGLTRVEEELLHQTIRAREKIEANEPHKEIVTTALLGLKDGMLSRQKHLIEKWTQFGKDSVMHGKNLFGNAKMQYSTVKETIRDKKEENWKESFSTTHKSVKKRKQRKKKKQGQKYHILDKYM